MGETINPLRGTQKNSKFGTHDLTNGIKGRESIDYEGARGGDESDKPRVICDRLATPLT